MSSTREINQACLVRHLTAENAHRLEETLATLTEDCVFEDVALQKTFGGRAGAAEYYRMWWSAFQIKVHRRFRPASQAARAPLAARSARSAARMRARRAS